MPKFKSVLRQLLRIEWPKPSVSIEEEPTIYFMLTPPNSGSTAIAGFVGQLNNVVGLREDYEGQWLIPGMHASDKWQPSKPVDYESVRAVWLEAYLEQKAKRSSIDSVFEKSPPNLVRYQNLRSTFRKSRFMVNIRNPYAYTSSIAHRNAPEKLQDEKTREQTLKFTARSWMRYSAALQSIVIAEGFPVLTYEDFCREPASVFSKFGLEAGLHGIDNSHPVKVKDYKSQSIRNMNEAQVARLTKGDIEAITGELSSDRNLLEFFGYDLLG